VTSAKTAAVMLIAALIPGAACLGDEATKPPKETVLLRQTYTPGAYLQSIRMKMDQTVQMGEMQMPQKMHMQFLVDVRISKPDTAGNKKMTWKYKRIRQSVQMMGMTMTYDSAAEKPQNPAMAQALEPLLKAEIVLVIGPDNKIKSVRGMDAVWKDMASKNPAMARMAGQMRKTMGDEMIKGMVEKFSELLPGKAVAVGDTWNAKMKMDVPVVGASDVMSTYKLKRLERGPRGRVAVLEVKSRMESKGPQKVQAGAGQVTLRKLRVETTGQTRVDVSNPLLLDSTMTQKGSMEMEMDAPPDQPGPISFKSQFTSTITIQCKPAPKTTTAPATGPAR